MLQTNDIVKKGNVVAIRAYYCTAVECIERRWGGEERDFSQWLDLHNMFSLITFNLTVVICGSPFCATRPI